MTKILACLALLFSLASPLTGAILSPTVTPNQVRVTIDLLGTLDADLTITFEQAVGLNLANLGLSARILRLTDLPILSRLPLLGGGTVLPAFPVLLEIEPPQTGGLSFSGIVAIELHTHRLSFLANCPFRLFAASEGGRFQDITEYIGTGSYRVRGTKGGFSQFLILPDLRPVDWVIVEKLNRVETLLEDYGDAIPPAILGDLTSRLAAVRTSYNQGAIVAAIQGVEGFIAEVQSHSGAEIPDVWRSAHDLENVAGYLRAAAGTLRFSLNLKANQGY